MKTYSRGIGLAVFDVSVFGVSVFGVSVFGVSVFGVSVFGVSVFGVSVFGVSVFVLAVFRALLSTALMVLAAFALLTASAFAQTSIPAPPPASAPPPGPPSNPACLRLESQLAVVNHGGTDPARADQIKRAEDAAAKQQAELDRTLAQGHKYGCEGGGFFALFGGQAPQCGPLNSQIQQLRDNLDQTMTALERLKSSGSDSESQRRDLISQLAQNNCGAQYQAAAQNAGPGGLLGALFGGIVSSGGDGAPAGTYRTVCVRTCDGYYFPISYSTVPTRFPDDQNSCQRLCPATEAALYSYRNPGEDIQQAVSMTGQPYTELPNAFRYRKEFSAACSCRRPGQSWADALKNADDATTLESGDIVVTDQNAKALSQAPQQRGAKAAAGAGAATPVGGTAATAIPAAVSGTGNQTVRTVGPPFMSAQ